MQIVIDIPDEQIEKSLAESKYIHENEGEKGSVDLVLLYTNKKLEFVDISRKNDFYSLTNKYTVLPKGHGDLIDRKLALSDDGLCEFHMYDDYVKMRNYLKSIPTIIEADKAGSEEQTE